MPSSSDTEYAARLPVPEEIERGADCTLRCPMYRDGALAAPTGGTVSVFDRSGVAQVDGASVAVTGSVATYALTAVTSTGWTLEDGWSVEWALQMPDGKTHTVRNEALVARRRLYCPVSDVDLYRRWPELDPAGGSPLTTRETFQAEIDEAWVHTRLRLIEEGDRPHLVISASALREYVLLFTAHLIFSTLDTRTNEALREQSRMLLDQANGAWRRIRLTYRPDDRDDQAGAERRGRPATTWLM